jgi:uncharacterized DUF497 family protein
MAPSHEVRGFDWDDGNLLKCQEHGMSIAEVESVFIDGNPQYSPDALIPEMSSDSSRSAKAVRAKGLCGVHVPQ